MNQNFHHRQAQEQEQDEEDDGDDADDDHEEWVPLKVVLAREGLPEREKRKATGVINHTKNKQKTGPTFGNVNLSH